MKDKEELTKQIGGGDISVLRTAKEKTQGWLGV